MIRISLCMIVKNEESVLDRCLNSIADLVEEIIIVDTGSTDATKEIASHYTDKVYDFAWVEDFSKARNFAFSKATQDYIYSADADEVLDGENRKRFQLLKKTLLPEIEIVQMKYANQMEHNTVYNYDEEYRPKLFRRLRTFVWQEPIHETVAIHPVVYDSDIVITHLPLENHAARDFRAFERQIEAGVRLSTRLSNMYAKELFIAGGPEEFRRAGVFFEQTVTESGRSANEVMEACLVVARAARLAGEDTQFFKFILKVVVGSECSEACYELGEFYFAKEDYEEAALWYYNARYETEPVLDIRTGQELALERLIECYHLLGEEEQAELYREERKQIE